MNQKRARNPPHRTQAPANHSENHSASMFRYGISAVLKLLCSYGTIVAVFLAESAWALSALVVLKQGERKLVNAIFPRRQDQDGPRSGKRL